MSFKEEYKDAFDKIVPEQEFLDKLSEKMKKEQQKRKRPYLKPLVTAACICLIILSGVAAVKLHTGNSGDLEPVHVNTGNTLKNPTKEPNLFATPKWYNENESPEKILSDFTERLEAGKELETLYKNTENNFTDEMIVSSDEIQELAGKLHSAEMISEEVGASDERTYYMAEFSNGDIIKFVIQDDTYFYFMDLEYVYKF